MKFAFRSASRAALIIGLAGSFQSALAQQSTTPAPAGPQNQTVATTAQQAPQETTPARVDQTTPGGTLAKVTDEDVIVITGSLTGSRETGELPIEVYSFDDMKKAGSPGIGEFVRSLSSVGDSIANTDTSLATNGGISTDLYGPGYAEFNLRGLSDADSQRTINLLNGRRTSGNANLLPMQALQQVEILKDGASATYGAGAVGGVVNFITRRDFDGVIIDGETKLIEGLDKYSQYELKYTQGWAGDASNLLISLSYNHQGEIAGKDLDWTRNAYEVNPNQWAGSTANNPSTWYSNNALCAPGNGTTTGPATACATTTPPGAAANPATGIFSSIREQRETGEGTGIFGSFANYPNGTAIADFTTSVCNSLGGVNPRTTLGGNLQDRDSINLPPASLNGGTGLGDNDSRAGNICYFDTAPFQMVQQETNRIGAFTQFIADISETMQLTTSVNYTKTDAPHIKGLPSQNPLGSRAPYGTNGNPNGVAGGVGFPTAFPATGGSPTLANYWQVGSGCVTGACSYAVPTNHPAIADFLARANANRFIPVALGTSPTAAEVDLRQILAANLPVAGQVIDPRTGLPSALVLPAANNLLWAGFFRPFSYGGLPNGSPYVEGYRKDDFWEGTLNVKGTFSDNGFFGLGKFLPEGTTYDFAITGSDQKIIAAQPDIVSYRLQEALNGFGGPNCHAADLVPHGDMTMPVRGQGPGVSAAETAAEFSARLARAVSQFNATIGTQNPAEAGKNGCLWFNPFVSAIPGNAATGAANPAYNPALANDPALADWLFTDAAAQTRNRELTIDVLFSGKVPGFELPGGPIGWGLGGQWRQTEFENKVIDPLYDPYRYDCPWSPWIPRGQIQQAPGDIGCFQSSQGQGGGTLMTKQGGGRLNSSSDRQTTALILEVSTPVLDNLSATLTSRYEEVSGSIGGWVHQFSTKWDATDWFAVRGSWSTNFTSPDPNILDNDGRSSAGPIGGLLNVPVVPITTIVQPDLHPEEAKQYNIGLLFNKDDLLGEGSRLRMSLDYFNIITKGEVSQLQASVIATRVFPNTAPFAGFIVNSGQPRVAIDCTSANVLMQFITLNSPCVPAVIVGGVVQNPTTATTLNNVVAANTVILNGPQLKSAGVDFSMDYSTRLFGGDLGIGFNGTRLLEFEATAAFYQGERIPLGTVGTVGTGLNAFGFSESYIGQSNASNTFGPGKTGSRWRASVYANYSTGGHNFRWVTRLISAVDDERGPQNFAGVDPVTGVASTTGGGTTDYGVDGEDYYTHDFNWTWDTPWAEGFQMRLSVLNVFDQDPAPYRGSNTGGLPYNPYIYSPYGRQWEIGFTKTF